MAFGAAGIGGTGNGFTVAALTVLADQESAVFAVYGEHAFAADRTFGVGQVIMTEGPVSCLDLPDDVLGIVFDVGEEGVFFQPAVCDSGKFHLPVCCQLRFFQVLRYQLQKLFCFGGDVYVFASFFHQEGVEKFINDIRTGGYGSKAACLAQCFGCFGVMAFHEFNGIFHGGEQGCLVEMSRRFFRDGSWLPVYSSSSSSSDQPLS